MLNRTLLLHGTPIASTSARAKQISLAIQHATIAGAEKGAEDALVLIAVLDVLGIYVGEESEIGLLRDLIKIKVCS